MVGKDTKQQLLSPTDKNFEGSGVSMHCFIYFPCHLFINTLSVSDGGDSILFCIFFYLTGEC